MTFDGKLQLRRCWWWRFLVLLTFVWTSAQEQAAQQTVQDLWTGIPTGIGFPSSDKRGCHRRPDGHWIVDTGSLSQLHPQGDPPRSMTRPMYAAAFLSLTMHPVPYNPVHECFTGADFYPCSAGEWSVTKNLKQVCMFSDPASWRRRG